MEYNRYSLRMKLYYWLIVFIVVLLSFVGVLSITSYLEERQILKDLSVLNLVSLTTVSTVICGFVSYFVGRRILAPMVKLSAASKEVAKGNYAVRVSDSSKMEEVQTTFRNFNAMIKQLDSISTLSNDFVANVSHEFKTPLTAVEGYAMLLQDPTLTEAERQEYLEQILDNIHRLTELVGNILLLSKIENKGLADAYSQFRLDEQIRQAVVLLQNQWMQKELTFEAELDEISIRASEGLLPHVWSNLIGNAIKFSPQGGLIELRLMEQKECVVFTVRDRGCGMSPEVQERIFEKFYQGDPSHKSKGHGLGLPMVKRIVELSDGVIEVESQEGQGTLFRVILPK